MIVRDIDLLKQMSEASVAFNNNDQRQQFEASTKDTEVRIDALRKLKESGIKTSALLSPVIPFITEIKPLIKMLAPYTEVIWIYGLSFLKRTDISWQNVQLILDNYYPGLKKDIESIVFKKDHPFWLNLRNELNKIKIEDKLNLNIRI